MRRDKKFSCAVIVFLVLSLPAGFAQQEPAETRSLGEIAREARQKQRPRLASQEDAKELFASIDSILTFASRDTGYPKRGIVKHQLIGREVVQQNAAQALSKDAQVDRLARSELVLKKFGLLPPGFALREYLQKSAGASLAAYYNPRDKTMYLLNWVPLEHQRTVMAHELTHALQDQNYDLLAFMGSSSKAAGEQNASPQMAIHGTDEGERSAARRAVVEGQAMVVYYDYLLIPKQTSLAESEAAQTYLSSKLESFDSAFSLHDAPRVLKDSARFPYREGLAFEIALLRQAGKKAAFSGAFTAVPADTHEVMHPADYLAKNKVTGVAIPDLRPILDANYEPYDSGTIGELDVRTMCLDFGRENDIYSVAAAWDGGSYVAVKRRTADSRKLTISDVAVVYVSRWKNLKAAKRFAEIYRAAIPRRTRVFETHVVDQTDCPAGTSCAGPIWSATLATEEGPTVLEILPGNTLMITHSFEPKVVVGLREAILHPGKAQLSLPSANELSLSLYESSEFLAYQETARREFQQDLAGALYPEP